MSYFKAKMHQIRFRLGAAPDPARGGHSAPAGPLTNTHTQVYLKWQHNNAEYKTQKHKKHTKQNRIVKTRISGGPTSKGR